jgi:DNA-binding GntR family transcriptional regulator
MLENLNDEIQSSQGDATASPAHLTELVGTTLGGRAKAAIRKAILSGMYEPGQRLSEVEIGAALGISRGPVRESIRALASEGLLELVPHRGPVVKKFTHDEFQQLYEVRRALEGFAALLAAQRATPDEVAQLRNVLAKALKAADTEEPAANVPGLDFHQSLIQVARSGQLQIFTDDVDTKLRLARTRSGTIPKRARESHSEHVAIVDAIEAGDGEAAERLMRAHLVQSQRHAEAVFEKSIT